MDEQLDNDLKDRIKEVFDNFDDASADEGWLLLREKFPEEEEKRRPLAWIWWGAVAAGLLLFLGLGLWIYNAHDQSEKFSIKPKKVNQPEKIASVQGHHDTTSKIVPARVVPPANRGANNPLAKASNPFNALPGSDNNLKPSTGKGIFAIDSTAQNSLAAKKADSTKNAIINKPTQQLAANNSQIANNNVAVNPNVLNNNPNAAPATPNTAKPAQAQSNTQTAQQQPARTLAQVIANEQKLSSPKSAEKIQTDRKVRFGVYAATYFNYAKGSDTRMSGGGGLAADIPITKNLKLVTGVFVGQNSLNYNSGPPQIYASTPSTLVAASVNAAYSPNYQVAAPSFKNYNASLVGLDVPVNLKYEFNPQKNSTYFSAGLSSGTFINESYTYQYNYPSLASAALQKTQDQTTTKSFNGFYFAKTLNLAFGVGAPLGKNRVIIEPFFKYPLDGMGSQQIKFGSGGINLKFNFQPGKK